MRPSLCLWLLLPVVPFQDPPAPAYANLQAKVPGHAGPPLPPTALPAAAVHALGQQLFADPILSLDRTVSCQSCHLPAYGFAHPDPRPPGIQGRRALRHAPVLWNRAYGRSQRWDGSTPTLEAFVLQPIADANEMGLSLTEARARLSADAGYRQAFAAAFADGVTEANLATALATFVRSITAPADAWDRFHQGEVQAMDAEARAGMWLFESKGGCWKCHTPGPFTDEDFHATGIGVQDGKPEPGRSAGTGLPQDRGRFKTPTLRQLARSAPYMHDGSLASLADVVEFYDRGGNAHDGLDPLLRPLHLTAAEKAQLLAFLRLL